MRNGSRDRAWTHGPRDGRAARGAGAPRHRLDAERRGPAHPGVTLGRGSADAVMAADILILSLFDDAAVREVLGRLAALDLSGRLVAETSTVAPSVVREAAPAIEAAGGRVIDAPISGGPEMVAAGTIGLFVGGAEDVARFAPIAGHLSPRVAGGGAGRRPCSQDREQRGAGGAWQAMIESMRLGARLGLDLDTMVGLLCGEPRGEPVLPDAHAEDHGRGPRGGIPRVRAS
jgi:3-hydroxyisobutyrate dehydrogenase